MFGKTRQLCSYVPQGSSTGRLPPTTGRGEYPCLCSRISRVPEALLIITRPGGVDRNQVPRGSDAPWSPGKVIKAGQDDTSGPVGACRVSRAAVAAAVSR